jgi:error-prone DNA polymerase
MAPHIRTTHAMRLGFRQIIGVKKKDMLRLVERRGESYDSVRDLWLRSGLSSTVLERLADADSFRSLGLDRRQALWAVRGLDRVGDQDDLPCSPADQGAIRSRMRDCRRCRSARMWWRTIGACHCR